MALFRKRKPADDCDDDVWNVARELSGNSEDRDIDDVFRELAGTEDMKDLTLEEYWKKLSE